MKSQQIVFTDINKAELLDTRAPERIGADQIRVETEVSLISPGTELSWYSGVQRDVAGDKFAYPIYPGYCQCGRVVEVGSEVEEYQAGDRIVSGAPHVSQFALSLEQSEDLPHGELTKPIHKLPEGLDPSIAPFAKIGEIAITAIRIAEFSLGDRVLVLGLGMVGNLAAQLFQLAGADVMAADISAFRLEKARTCGLQNVINSQETDLQQVVQEWSGGLGADVCVESVGSSRLILQSIALTRKLGDVILLGTPRRKMELNPSPHLWQAHMRGVRLKGALRCLFYPLYPRNHSRYSVSADLSQILKLLAGSRLKAEPLHTDTFMPQDCQDAYRHVQEAGDRAIGVLFDWSG